MKLERILGQHRNLLDNPPRETLIKEAMENQETLVSASGALATWTPPESTGRSPEDTVIVKREESQGNIDWDSPYINAIDPETFDMALEDALNSLAEKQKLYLTDRVIGADPSYALPTRTVTDRALTALFTVNMFRPVPQDAGKSIFADDGFTLIALPYEKLDPSKYQGRLRVLPNGETSTMIVGIDFDRRIGVVIGSAYRGTVKKLMFTVMNYLLPPEGILPIHCSATEGPDGNITLLLGLSGTGKTTLSADPKRALLGDDEHGWSETGIANFENGSYAKLLDLNPEKEPVRTECKDLLKNLVTISIRPMEVKTLIPPLKNSVRGNSVRNLTPYL
ncbi:MAG: phosphoenolpyruvate carboxykinase (ATP) [Candidatus Bipolaricaulia bacterium]